MLDGENDLDEESNKTFETIEMNENDTHFNEFVIIFICRFL